MTYVRFGYKFRDYYSILVNKLYTSKWHVLDFQSSSNFQKRQVDYENILDHKVKSEFKEATHKQATK